jgi:hypothetical protein
MIGHSQTLAMTFIICERPLIPEIVIISYLRHKRTDRAIPRRIRESSTFLDRASDQSYRAANEWFVVNGE